MTLELFLQIYLVGTILCAIYAWTFGEAEFGEWPSFLLWWAWLIIGLCFGLHWLFRKWSRLRRERHAERLRKKAANEV